MTDDTGADGGALGVHPEHLGDTDLQRELTHLHDTRRETVLHGSQEALATHTVRMLALEAELRRRLPGETTPAPRRTPAGSRREAGQEP